MLLASSPVVAQDAGTKIGSDLARVDYDKEFRSMITCMVKRYPADAVGMLRFLPGSRAENRLYARLTGAMETCVSAYGSTNIRNFLPETVTPVFRRAFARQLVLANPNLVQPVSGSGESDPLWFSEMAKESHADFDANALVVEDFAHCVARRDWPGARRVALSPAGSIEEQNAVTSLVDAFGPCVPTGKKISLSRDSLPSIIAEAVYHLSVKQELEKRYPPTGRKQ